MDPELLCNKMNEKLPSGIRFVEGRIVDEKLPSLMSLIERAEYAISAALRSVFKGHLILKK
jgi:uncharacterized protein (DUF2344 family)